MTTLLPGAPGRPLEVLCLGAHCDDIEIGCGGTLLRLLSERPGSKVVWAVFAATAERERELRASARDLLACAAQSAVRVFDFRESYFPWVGAEMKDAIESLSEGVAPDLILTHRLEDRHQDHRTVAELTWNTFRDHWILEYEVPKYDGDLGQPNVFVPLAEGLARRKVELLLTHYRSQAEKRWFRGSTFEAVMRLRGVECAAAEGWAEAFHGRKLLVQP